MKYPQYENYKDSRLNWLETIPENWEVKRIKFISKIFGRIGFRGYNADDLVGPGEGAITLGAGQIDKNDKIDLSSPVYLSWEKYEESPEIKVRKGDIIFGQRGSIGKVAYIDKEYGKVTINPSLILLKDIKLNPIYLTFFLQSPLIRKWVQLIGNSTAVPMISQEQFANFPCLIPPTEEQQSIANFLDKETTRLDALISKKQQLIETLKEKRIAVISQAVTKGIKPDVPLKDSGIEWLGMIPKDWEVKKLKYVLKGFESGVSVNSINTPALDEEIGVLKTSCVYDYTFRPSENKVVLQDDLDRVSCQVKADSIIMSRMNTPDLVGASGYVEKDYGNLFLPDRLWQTVLWPHVKVHVKWLSYIFITKGFRSLISSMATGTSSSMKNITQGNVLNIKVGVPDYQEQVTISNYLDSEFNKIEKIIGLTEKHIDKLIEYKTALISAAVTGKIKVPEQA